MHQNLVLNLDLRCQYGSLLQLLGQKFILVIVVGLLAEVQVSIIIIILFVLNQATQHLTANANEQDQKAQRALKMALNN